MQFDTIHPSTAANNWVDKLGGEPGMRRILGVFYDRLYSDLMVGFFFHPHDKSRLIESQLRFVGRALGGTIAYDGPPLRTAHESLPILPGHFWRRHRLLEQTLADLNADPEASAAWLALDRRLFPAIVRGAC